MKHYLLILIIQLLVISPFALSEDEAEAPPIIATSSIDKAQITTSDELTFTVEIKVKKEIKLDLPEIGGAIEGFRVIDSGEEGPVRDEDYIVSKRWYKLRADITGSYILPAIEIRYKDQEGAEKSIKTSEIFVEVTSVLQKDGEKSKDIRDIKGLIKIPKKWKTWEIVTLIICLLIVVAFGVLIYFLRRPKKTIVPPRPVHEVALERLTQLKEDDPLSIGDDKYFHFTLSDIIREYFEGMFKVTATDMTFEEIKSEFTSFNEINDDLKASFLEIMKDTDLVKFTDMTISQKRSNDILDQAFDFVALTKPDEQVEEDSVI
ncbi:MAG: hypothetical protein ISR65_09160 [Bacteriovoracaceae bacterium]|nr:hypothetical protein [Bacteriovoracaceae bacterium]